MSAKEADLPQGHPGCRNEEGEMGAEERREGETYWMKRNLGATGGRESTRKARQPSERIRVWIEEPDFESSESQFCHFPAV